ncbi:Antilisterial bacteriocin subtilosin biosynthesis protein AlbE [Paraliobacillus sp. PM-2]|uniref:EF-P 5-aminopentanol modification-associated protein YfmF n=1 Tax=Paraliobacillus sp. PM-2 TaxID=1462524 RepID=UPI00061C9CB3|nr:pitrilysin family protein [Paraliobacillus sp. PM-2]CQR47633.1 Antilisterial bacteriocin subtilosin biosynthesis protein AlbE [Paraliobacillus sp. PM-2]
MTISNEKISKQNGYQLHVINTKKFKTIHIVLKFRAPLTKENITKRALLPFVLQQGTTSYPTQNKFRQALDNLYGSELNMDGAKKGNNHILTLRMEIANQGYLTTDTNIFHEAVKLLHEVIYSPKASNGAFDENIVTREKQTLKQKIHSIIDNKMSYANMRLIDEMCAEEAYRLHVHGYEDDLESINAQTLYQYYQELLSKDQMDIYVLGDFSSINVEDTISSYFNHDRHTQSIENSKETYNVETTKEIEEQQNIQQAKLHLGYRTDITYGDSLYPALQVFNGVFGGFPSSKLFINVREKNSLAYYAASRFESHKGLLLVFSGIAPNDYKQAKQIILEQMEAMKKGEFSEEDVEESKKQVKNQWKETIDHPNGLIEILYHQVLANADRTPTEVLTQINHVAKSDLMEVASKLQLDTVYFLTAQGGKNDE